MPSRPQSVLLYITARDGEEAAAIARTLLNERLVACANLLPGVTSLYWWEGALQEGQECVLIAKTMENLVSAATERVKALHSYSCPCVVALPIKEGNSGFLQWIAQETAPSAQ